MQGEPEHSSRKTTSGFAKTLILTQSLVISFFSFWFYQEYVHSEYFRAYLDSSFRGMGLLMLAVAGVVILAFTALGLRWQRSRGAMEFTAERKPEAQPVLGLIDNRTEAHLIEMIRRSGPADETSSSDEMPSLKQRDQP